MTCNILLWAPLIWPIEKSELIAKARSCAHLLLACFHLDEAAQLPDHPTVTIDGFLVRCRAATLVELFNLITKRCDRWLRRPLTWGHAEENNPKGSMGSIVTDTSLNRLRAGILVKQLITLLTEMVPDRNFLFPFLCQASCVQLWLWLAHGWSKPSQAHNPKLDVPQCCVQKKKLKQHPPST